MKKAIIPILILLAIAAGGWWLFGRGGSGNGDGELPEYVVKRGDLAINVLEGGNIQALEYHQVKNNVKSSGGVKLMEVVDEGYEVTQADIDAGKVLVKLDGSALEERLVDHDVEFQQTEALYIDAKQDIEIQESESLSAIKEERQSLRFALLDFEKFVGKEAAQNILSQLRLPYDSATLDSYEAQATRLIKQSFDTAKLASNDEQLLDESGFLDQKQDSLATAVDFNSFLERDQLQEGEAEQMVRKMKDEALVASSQLKVVEENVSGAQRLRDRNFITKQTLDNELVNLEKAKLSVQTKETELDLFVDYEFPKEAEKMLSNYEEALLELVRNKREQMAQMSKIFAKYRSAKRRYELELKKREELEEQLASCSIRAEAPGLVAYGGMNQNYYSSRYYEGIAVGATMKFGQPIITIPNMTKLGVEVNIHESQIKKVQIDQNVLITAEAFPEEVLAGRVSKVAVLPDSNASRYNPSLKVYPSTIEVTGSNDFLKPGMTAKVEILVKQLSDVVYVPVQAIHVESDEHFVFLKKGLGGFDRHPVTTGDHNDEFIAVLEGLKEGETIALSTPEDYEPPAKSSKGKKKKKKA